MALYTTATTQILNLSNLLKAAISRGPRDLEENRAAKRQRYQEDLEENRAAKRQRYQEDLEEKGAAKRQRYQEDLEENRAAKRQRYQEDLEENRAAKRQRYQEDLEENRAAKKAERSRRTIQLTLRHLKRVGIGITLMLSDWLNICHTRPVQT
eukprot:Em0021g908a